MTVIILYQILNQAQLQRETNGMTCISVEATLFFLYNGFITCAGG